MKKNLKESRLREIIRGVIQEMFNDDLTEGDMVDGSEADTAASMEARASEENAEKAQIQAVDEESEKVVVAEEEINEDSGEEEEEHYDRNVDDDEGHIDAIRTHLDALEHDKDYDEGHEELRETFFPKERSIRQKARMELNEALMKRWSKIVK